MMGLMTALVYDLYKEHDIFNIKLPESVLGFCISCKLSNVLSWVFPEISLTFDIITSNLSGGGLHGEIWNGHANDYWLGGTLIVQLVQQTQMAFWKRSNMVRVNVGFLLKI